MIILIILGSIIGIWILAIGIPCGLAEVIRIYRERRTGRNYRRAAYGRARELRKFP